MSKMATAWGVWTKDTFVTMLVRAERMPGTANASVPVGRPLRSWAVMAMVVRTARRAAVRVRICKAAFSA